MTRFIVLLAGLGVFCSFDQLQAQDPNDTLYASEAAWRIDKYDGICALTTSGDWASPLTINRNAWGSFSISLDLPEDEIPAGDADRFEFAVGKARFEARDAKYGSAYASDLFEEFENALLAGKTLALTRNGDVRTKFSLDSIGPMLAKLETCAEGNYPTPPSIMKVD